MTSAWKCLLDHETPLDNVEPSNFQKYELYSLNLLSLCNIDLGIKYSKYVGYLCNEKNCLILDSPIVNLKFGTSLDPSNIAEGNDVYFECEIDANPDVYKIVWLHNVSFKKCEFHNSTTCQANISICRGF